MLYFQKRLWLDLITLTSHTREHLDIIFNKVHRIHDNYLANNPFLYSAKEKEILNIRLNHVLDKFFFASISEEQLHSLKLGKIDNSLKDIFEKNITSLDYSNNESLISSYLLENFLFESRSFLNIYKIYICLLLKTGYSNQTMKKDEFYKQLTRTPEILKQKSTLVYEYFTTHVFADISEDETSIYRNDWGTILVALRDKIAHRDILVYSNESNEKIAFDILINSPTIKSIPIHHFASTISNEMHKLLYDVLSNLFDMKWNEIK